MSNFAKWYPVTYSNNNPPHINATHLNKNEEALTMAMGELNSYNSTSLKDFLDMGMNYNVKEIHNFEIASDFTLTGSMSLGNMYEDSIFGVNAVKITDLNDSGGSIGIYETFSSLNLATFPNGSSSTTSDYIIFAFYVTDATKFQSILLRLGDDDTDCYYKYYNFNSGWNIKKYKKSQFGTDGTPTGWNDITFIRIYVQTKANASSDYVGCAKLWLARKESGGTSASSLYVTDGGGTYDSYMYLQGQDDMITYFDKRIGKKGIHNAYYYSPDMLQVMEDVNCFSIRAEVYTKIDADGFNIEWYINSYTSIRVLIRELSLSIVETVDNTLNYIAGEIFSDSIESNDRITIWVEKTTDNIIRARAEIDGQKPVYAEGVVNLSSTISGNLGISASIEQYYFITDFVANNNPSIPLPNFSNSLQKLVVKHYESPTLTTTLANDDELFIKLPSNSLFEVELVLIYSSNGSPDLKIKWVATGDYETINDGRVFIAAGNAVSSFTDIPLAMNNYALDTESELGIVSGGEMPYYEKILIKTGASGCKLQLQWAQYNVSGSYIQVDKGSYIRAIKV